MEKGMPYRTALVLGLGASGRAAAMLLLGEGAEVTVVDRADEGEALEQSANEIEKAGASVLLGVDELSNKDFEVAVVSPGISSDSHWVKALEEAGVPVISELELGASRCTCPMLAITGSNGNSTMAKLCGEALTIGGRNTVVAGNYGLPLSEAVVSRKSCDALVVEVSSFQLEKVRTFHPRVGVLLNVQPDHLDRHGGMENYYGLKSRLFSGMNGNDAGVVSESCLETTVRLSGGRNRWITFGLSENADYRVVGSAVTFRENGAERSISIAGTYFANEVTGLTAAAAAAALSEFGVEPGVVERAAAAFVPLPHRMARVAAIGGVSFVNDSKATNLAALCGALKIAGPGIRLIAGGLLKEKSLESPKELLAKNVRKVYLIGKAAEEMAEAWNDVVQCCMCSELETAVQTARADAAAGETILLSPGCASFDQFRNFEDRGTQFEQIIASLVEET
jgi:UDP-N-acetylmuramoylalanine--D-glutamate ligase